MKTRLLLIALLAPFTFACGSDDDGGDSDELTWQGTYALDIAPSNWVEPAGIGPDIGAFVTQFLLDVEGTSKSDFTITVGLSRDGDQDTCSKTVSIPATASGNDMTAGPSDYEIYLPSAPAAPEELSVVAAISKFKLTNVLPKGSTQRDDGELTAQADARDLWPLFYQIIGADPDTVCAALENPDEGTMCEACSDGEPYCLTMTARGIGAAAYSGDFQEVDESCPAMLPEE